MYTIKKKQVLVTLNTALVSPRERQVRTYPIYIIYYIDKYNVLSAYYYVQHLQSYDIC